MKTVKFVRKPFEVDAVQVTADNMPEVAAWCEGEVGSQVDRRDPEKTERYVKVHVHRPLNEKQTRAFAGDWVLRAETGFKVYTNRAIRNSFEQAVVYTEADALAQLGESEESTNLFQQPRMEFLEEPIADPTKEA